MRCGPSLRAVCDFHSFLVQVYPAGDANGDGLKDFAVITSTMKTYVVFGSKNQAKTGVWV